MTGTGPAPHRRVAGRTTAWWGTILLLVVLASMLSTFLFAQPYLATAGDLPGGRGDGSASGAARAAGLLLPAVAAALALASLVPAILLHRAGARAEGLVVQPAAVATALTGAGFITAAVVDLQQRAIDPTASAYGSAVVVTVVFHLVVAVAAVLLLLGLTLRVWGAALDERTRSGVTSAALLWYYVVGGWLLVSATVHLPMARP